MSFQKKFTFAALACPLLWGIYSACVGQYGAALSALLTVVCILAFAWLNKKFPVFSVGVYCAVLLFVLLSVFAGRVWQFYTRVPYWDKLLHFLSGFLLYAVGAQIYTGLCGKENARAQRLFSVIFAVAAAGAWEIYEFLTDLLFGLRSQNGSLSDTMTDIIAGSVSALLALFCTKKPSSKR